MIEASPRPIPVCFVASNAQLGGTVVGTENLLWAMNEAGVAPSVVMLFMRHRTMRLSMVDYNDPRMHDARKALGALPKLDETCPDFPAKQSR